MENKKLKTVTVFTSKGGCGKSTVNCFLAFELSKYGKVLMVDGDPQASMSFIWIENKENKTKLEAYQERYQEKNLYNVLRGNVTVKDAIFQIREENDEFKGLYLLPERIKDTSDEFRSYLAGQFSNNPDVTIAEVFEQIEELGFDYVVWDIPGKWDYYERNMMSFIENIIPISGPEEIELQGIYDFIPKIERCNKVFRGGIGKVCNFYILNKFERDNVLHQRKAEITKKKLPEMEQIIINKSQSIGKSLEFGYAIQEYSKSHKMSKAMALIAEKINEE